MRFICLAVLSRIFRINAKNVVMTANRQIFLESHLFLQEKLFPQKF